MKTINAFLSDRMAEVLSTAGQPDVELELLATARASHTDLSRVGQWLPAPTWLNASLPDAEGSWVALSGRLACADSTPPVVAILTPARWTGGCGRPFRPALGQRGVLEPRSCGATLSSTTCSTRRGGT